MFEINARLYNTCWASEYEKFKDIFKIIELLLTRISWIINKQISIPKAKIKLLKEHKTWNRKKFRIESPKQEK